MQDQEKYINFTSIFTISLVICIVLIMLDLFLIFRKRLFNHQLEIEKTRIETTEQVFKDISYELHDNIITTLSLDLINLDLSNYKDPLIHDIKNSLRQTIHNIRNLSHVLTEDYTKIFDLVSNLSRIKYRLERAGIGVMLNIELFEYYHKT